jgi:hypothetical protein
MSMFGHKQCGVAGGWDVIDHVQVRRALTLVYGRSSSVIRNNLELV